MRLTLGSLLVTIKYTYPRGSTTIYQRAVPTDLRGRYPGATIKQNLKTADPIKVARLVEDLNRKLEAEWAGLRAAPESSPQSLKAHAVGILKTWGLAPQGARGVAGPGNDPQALALLHDHIDGKRERHAGKPTPPTTSRLWRLKPGSCCTGSGDELSRLAVACYNKDDAQRWILAMLTDTGARLAEVVGLALADIVTDAEVPHIVIKPHPWRSLKNTDSARSVPLAGVALWAAQRVKATATEGQRFAFPQYTTETECRATSASGALAGWIRRLPMEHTSHDLRHTMADRLKAVQCPKDIRYAIDGHAAQDVGDTYGSTGHGLKVKAEWLGKIALKVSA